MVCIVGIVVVGDICGFGVIVNKWEIVIFVSFIDLEELCEIFVLMVFE